MRIGFKRLIRSKRALSPVVSTIFLFAVIFGAIAVSLGIIYPQVRQLNDNLELENASNSLVLLDKDIKNLIESGTGTIVSQTVDIGKTGALFNDPLSSIVSLIAFANGTYSQLQSNQITHTRISINNTITEDVIPKNTHSYLSGGTNQNFVYINSSLKSTVPWEILNQSRGLDNNVITSLSYRGIVSISEIININTLQYNETVSIQTVEFHFINKSASSSTRTYFQLNYVSVQITNFNWMQIVNTNPSGLAYGIIKIATTMNGLTSSQIPFKHEVPIGGTLYMRLQFVKHIINVYI